MLILVPRCQSFADGLCVCAEGNDQLRGREQAADVEIEATAQVVFVVVEQSAGVKEAGEAVKVQVQTAVC